MGDDWRPFEISQESTRAAERRRRMIDSEEISDVELNTNKNNLIVYEIASSCDHEWEPNLWDNGSAYCYLCGSHARWTADPRIGQST